VGARQQDKACLTAKTRRALRKAARHVVHRLRRWAADSRQRFALSQRSRRHRDHGVRPLSSVPPCLRGLCDLPRTKKKTAFLRALRVFVVTNQGLGLGNPKWPPPAFLGDLGPLGSLALRIAFSNQQSAISNQQSTISHPPSEIPA